MDTFQTNMSCDDIDVKLRVDKEFIVHPEDVVIHFLSMLKRDDIGTLIANNWGCAATSFERGLWMVSDGAYINGLVLVLDQDYEMGYVLQVCGLRPAEANKLSVDYVSIVMFHGFHPDGSAVYDFDILDDGPDRYDGRRSYSKIIGWCTQRLVEMMENKQNAVMRAIP